MEALRAKFIARCQEDLEVVRQGAEHPAFRLVAHRLSGIAPMFGFVALGEVATEVDAAFSDGGSPEARLAERLADALAHAIVAGPS